MLFGGFFFGGGRENRHDPSKAWKGGQPGMAQKGLTHSLSPGTGYGLGVGEGSALASGRGKYAQKGAIFSNFYLYY